MGEAPTSPISLWVPFRNGETWIVGGSGSFYGNYAHGNCQNDYYATDWNRADDYNAEVLPAAPGDLTYATSPCLSTALGCYVQVTHANDIKTTYGHLSQIYQNSGKAELGKRIGAVGSTGCIANDPPCSPHLHLGFHKLADGIYSSRCNSGINGGKCPNGESPRSPQTPRPSPINTSSGSSALKDGDSYTSNNTSGSDPGSNCPNVSYNGVILYRDKDCRGGEKSFDNVTGWVNLPDFNDDASSIYVKSGWSARVYEHASYDQGGGRHRCINGSMWDLTKDYYPDSSTKIDGTISSVQVFKNGSCSSDPPSSCPDGQFKAEYYDGRSFNNLVFARCENSINYDWGGGGPGNGLGNDEFSVRWTGRFGFDGGTKRFIARADDGIKVYLDGTTIIDGWKDQAPTSYTNERTPSAGTHEVKVEYYEKGGGAVAQFRWENVATSISCPDGQFKAEYFNGRTLSGGPIYARCEDRVNYDWGGGGPGNGVPNDNFSVRWTGRFNFDGGTKRFIARADDGIRVYLDGSLIINEWRDQGATEYRAERTPSAGTREVKVEYYENGGGAVAQVRWENVATNITCPDGQFKAEYYNASSSSAVYARCENSINYDWGGGGPGNGVNNDNFAVRWTGRFGFDGGTKRFIARADDGIKVYLDGTIIIDGWKDQAPTSYTNERTPSAGTHEVKVEYYEKGGGAVAQFRWENVATSISCPNQYKAEYWSNRYMSGNPVLVRCENWPLNNDWGNGGPGGGVPNDGFSARWTTQAAINQGTYTFIARADDGIKVYLDGSTIIDGWKDQGATEYRTTRSLNGGNYTIRIDYYENGGGAVAQFRWEAAITSGGNMALNRPAYASSQESSTYSPSKANDGSNSTRWSSMISATLGEEIWFADLGSQRSFNRVRINWEAAYAATYLVVWSDDGDTWYCFCDTVYTRGSSGWAEHNFDTRTRRYVGVIMLTRAPKMNNYSFYEFEVYGPAAATNPAGAEGAPVETTVPEMIEKEIDLPPQD